MRLTGIHNIIVPSLVPRLFCGHSPPFEPGSFVGTPLRLSLGTRPDSSILRGLHNFSYSLSPFFPTHLHLDLVLQLKDPLVQLLQVIVGLLDAQPAHAHPEKRQGVAKRVGGELITLPFFMTIPDYQGSTPC